MREKITACLRPFHCHSLCFSSSISGSKCHMVLSMLPLLLPTRHQTQISYLGCCPGRLAHTSIDRLTHSETHIQVLTASLLTIRPHLSVEMLAKRARFKPDMIKTDNSVASAVSTTFYPSCISYTTISIHVVMKRSSCICLPAFLNACMSIVNVMWMEGDCGFKAAASSTETKADGMCQSTHWL